MQGYFTFSAFVLLIVMVVLNIVRMKKLGIKAIHFGKIDKKDFLIAPFALFYFYLLIANVFNLPKLGNLFVQNNIVCWIGVAFCVLALTVFVWGLLSFGESFRIGIDTEKYGGLVKTGVFSISRNPLYLAQYFMLLGVFLTFPTWLFFTYLMAGMWLIDRQVCREENFLKSIYGDEYDEYCKKVRRYL